MARIFLDANESRNGFLANNDIVFGNTGTETVTINTGATNVRIDGTVEGIALANSAASYTFLAQGNNLVVFSGGVEVARVIVQDDADGTSLTFPDGQTEVRVGAGGITIGGTAVPTGTPGPVVPGNLNPDTQLTAALQTLAAAQAAVADFQDGLEDDPATPGLDESDVDAVALATATAVDAELDAALGANVDFVNAGANVQQGLIADGRAALETRIAAETRQLGAAERTVGANVVAAINNVNALTAAAETAIEAAVDADVLEDGARANYNTVNSSAYDIVLQPTNNEPAAIEMNGVTVATLQGNTWVLETSNAAQTALAGARGFDAYLATLQDQTDARVAATQALDALRSAVAQVVALENGDSTITADDLADGVIDIAVDADGNATVTVDYTVSVAAPNPPTVSTTDGVTATTETAVVTFRDLAPGESVTVNGLQLNAQLDPITATQVASFFASGGTNLPLDATRAGANDALLFTIGSQSGTSVTYTAATSGNVVNISATNVVTVDTTSGLDAVTEQAAVLFTALTEGQSVTVEGLTLTATDNISADDVAAAFANLTPGATGGSVTNGVFSGTLSGDFTSGAVAGSTVIFTSTVGNENVPDIDVSVAGDSPTAPGAQLVVNERAELAAAQAELQDLNDAIAAWQGAVAQQETLAGLNAAVDAARAAIQDPVAEGGLGVTLREGNQAFTAGDDVYLFSEGTNQSLANFGVLGTDRIYVGDDYTLVTLGNENVATEAVGSASVLEAFIQQIGANTVISFESETFNGSETDGSFDGTVITLTNVNAADVSFANGYFTIA